jgi:O-antigen/teichoic acid export membrane protein
LDSQETATPEPESVSAPLAPAAAVSASRKMDRSLAGSLAWKAAGDWISQIFAWVSLLIVVRLLSPADFGLVGMAVILLPYLRYIGEFGVPRVIVNFPDLTDDQIAQLNTFSLILGFICFGLAIALAHPVALFFRSPKLAPVVIVTCSALIPWGFRAVSEGLLNKEMAFRQLSVYDAINAIAAAVITLVMAYLGYGYWSLVWGNVVATIIRTGLILWARPYRYAWPKFSVIREHLLFGWHVLVSVVALNSYQRLDNMTVGRVLGQTALGFYGMAWVLANVPLEKVTSLVTTVVPSYLAVVQKQPAELRRYVRTLTEAMALLTFPATVGLGLVAKELIPIALGHKWDGVVLPLEILSIYAAFRSIVALLSKVLVAVGNARFVMWNDLFALCLLPIAFYIGSRWGTAGVAWGWVAAYPLVAVPLYRKTFKMIDMKMGEYMRGVRPALDGTIVMTVFVLLVKFLRPSSLPLSVQLAIEIVAGFVAYTGTIFLFYRQRMNAFLEMAKGFRRKRRPQAAPAKASAN